VPIISARKALGLVVALWIAGLAGATQVGEAAAGALTAQDIVGTYRGELWSDGAMRDATTTFYLDSEGRLAGAYDYDEDGTTQTGNLIKPEISTSGEVTFIWQDKFGFGTLTISFFKDFSQFAGMWSTLEDGADAFPWFGKRVK
jgi:hypothetical protein